MRGTVTLGIASLFIVSVPFAVEKFLPRVESQFVVVPLCPGIQLTSSVFDHAELSAFDRSGDLRLGFVVTMVVVSFALWLAALHVAVALFARLRLATQRQRAAG